MATKAETQIALTQQEVKLMKEQNTVDHAAIQKDVCSVKTDVKDLKDYVIKAIETKADQSAVESLYKGIWSVVLIGISAFVGLIVWLIQGK